MSGWILRLCGLSMLCAAAMALCPEGAAKKALKTVCSFVIVSGILSLGLGFDWDSYALRLEEYRLQGQQLAQNGEDSSRAMTRLVIQRQCAAYILDKAQALGMDIECSVSASWNTQGYWVPYACTVEGGYTEGQRRELSAWIEANLGIPASGQHWTTQEEQSGT